MGRAAKPVRKVPIAKDGAASPRDDDAARTPRVEDAALTPRDRAFLESPPEDALADDAVAGDALAGDVPAGASRHDGAACAVRVAAAPEDESDDEPAPPGALFARVGRFLDNQGFVHDAEPERHFFALPYRIADASLRVILDVLDDGPRSRVLVLALLPVRVPVRRRGALAEALCRINYESVNGTFEMDLADGEMRVRTFADVGAGFEDAIVDRALGTAIVAADKYFAALMAIAFGSADPVKVLELAQRGEGRELQ